MVNFKLIKIGTYRPKGFGFRVQDEDGKVMVTYASEDGAAYTSGLRCGDVLHSINGKILDNADDLTDIIRSTRGDILLEVLKNSVGLQSVGNTSKSSSRSSDSSQKMTTSMSSVDLSASTTNRRILDVNYVPDEHIDQYLQPMSPNDTFHNSMDALESKSQSIEDNSVDSRPSQIIRKQAYNRSPFDIGQSEAPRISIKRGNKTVSLPVKDLVYTMKKRTNAKMGDVVLSLTNPRSHNNAVPLDPSQQNPPSKIINSYSSTQLSNLSTSGTNSASSNFYLTQSSVSSSQPPASKSDYGQPECSKMDVTQVEAELRIISFKEKIKKPSWRIYVIEKDALGVMFQSIGRYESDGACNSTAIDPLISGLQIYMRLWHINNTTFRFFLPIAQHLFSQDIEITMVGDNIEVKYDSHNVHLQINYSKMAEDKRAALFNLLAVKVQSTETIQQTKKSRPIPNLENFKNDTRKQKVPKLGSESARVVLLSTLPQSSLVEKVPLVVIICVNIIEKRGMKLEGIYRKSGSEIGRKKLESVMMNEEPEKWAENEYWSSMNTVCSLLKSILRSYSLVDKDTAIKLSMINLANKDKPNQEQVYMDMLYHLRQSLSKPESRTENKERSSLEILCRRETFKYVLKHLNRVTQSQCLNKMTDDNLATCFSPTIFEDIPFDDNGEYHTSKKCDADQNLRQMLIFWIKYADFICELLEENDDEEILNKVVMFSENKYHPPIEEATEEVENGEEELQNIIEVFTKTAIIPISESESLLNIQTAEINSFTRLKNLGAYRSYKQPKKDVEIRRSSSSWSPQEMRRKDNMEATLESTVKGAIPIFPKRADNWTSKSFRNKKKDNFLIKKKLPLDSMILSGSKKGVPLVVDVCVTIIERYGLDLDGIYRISGKKQDINSLEELVVNNKVLEWIVEKYVAMWSNLYVVSCLLKSVLKQYCLIKKDTWVHMASQFSEKMGDNDVRNVLMASAYYLRHVKNKVKVDVTASEYEETARRVDESDIRSATLRYVLRHLNKVSQHFYNNRMTSNSLAVCFVPVLMEEDESATANIMTNNNKGIQILEKLIDHCDWIFQWDDSPSEDLYGKVMTDSLDCYLNNYSKNYAERIDNDIILEHILDNDCIKQLLEIFIIHCEGKVTQRRHSDVSNSSKKLDFTDQANLDDNDLQDVSMSSNMHNNCSRSLQNTDSLL